MKNSTAAEVTTDTMTRSLFSVSHGLSVTVMAAQCMRLFILINCSKIIFACFLEVEQCKQCANECLWLMTEVDLYRTDTTCNNWINLVSKSLSLDRTTVLQCVKNYFSSLIMSCLMFDKWLLNCYLKVATQQHKHWRLTCDDQEQWATAFLVDDATVFWVNLWVLAPVWPRVVGSQVLDEDVYIGEFSIYLESVFKFLGGEWFSSIAMSGINLIQFETLLQNQKLLEPFRISTLDGDWSTNISPYHSATL